MTDWPAVVGEIETVKAVSSGASISRFGDGEFSILRGVAYTRELKPSDELIEELRRVIEAPAEGCLIGIPTMDPKGDKYANWRRHKARYGKWLVPGFRYHSAFITRPDCGRAWMECQEYAELLRSIWCGKRVAVVSESYSKLLSDIRSTNDVVEHMECPMYGAYEHIDQFEGFVVGVKPDIALLSCGVTATALANRLAGRVIHAVDIGSVGGFLQRWPAK